MKPFNWVHINWALSTCLKIMLSTNYSITNYIYIYIYHHHHVVPQSRISLTLSRHFSLSSIASSRSSGPHPVSSHSCWMYVRAGCLAFARPYVGVHRSTSEPTGIDMPSNTNQLILWRCPWCSRYRRRKWTRRHEFKSWTTLIAFHIALIPLGKVWIQLFSLQLWVNSRTD